MTRLLDVDLSQKLDTETYEELLETQSARLAQLRLALGGKLGSGDLGPGLLIIMEGWDASGKGGAIKRLVSPLDARHVRVASFAAPSPDEKRHHYLLRFTGQLPGLGGMAVFDRSWYGRVLVERVEGFASVEQWSRAYAEIAEFERTLWLEQTIIVKVWMQISPDEQLKRFKKREKDPLKQWKLTDEDWRNREKWDAYQQAVEEMIERTDTTWAPWSVISGEDKKHGRIAVMDAVIHAIERGCAHFDFPLPEPLDAERV